ncbi:rhamnulokinase [Anaerosporobacter faecicola]|uniref:rhamnulokinase n=1 Tax=Anaerosporobacter faecicola TaxID=2718714 RepID=UPI001EE4EDD9|nr:rhamnulokinase [Anaerosporobacter faecicola]
MKFESARKRSGEQMEQIQTEYYLAVDIGASSGRHILGYRKDGKLQLEEVYRFQNGLENQDGTLCWNLPQLFDEILTGLRRCKEINKIPSYMGVDTWGVDFVLLDKQDQIIGKTVGYRDERTEGMDHLVQNKISNRELYERTGIQKQIFNTIYQLMAIKEKNPDWLDRAESMLMIPDYFHFLLTGVKKMEYTNATTTQLVHAREKAWDQELISLLGYPKHVFKELSMPGELVGNLLPKVQEYVGFDCQVLLPATHDTGSAVLAVPAVTEDILYISSGTWSLMGTEQRNAICTEESQKNNFTNEGGYEHRFRYLKNIMGLWMIQSMKKEIAQDLSFAQICEMASKESIASLVDCNDGRFLAPKSMTEAIRCYCKETNQQEPQTIGEVASVIYNSLAKCYGDTVTEIEEMTGKHYSTIHIVGGGANAEYLNHLTARHTKRVVLAGPIEATAIGNILAQMLHTREFSSILEARTCVKESFAIKEYDA